MTVDTLGIPDPERDLFSDAMDAAAGAYRLCQSKIGAVAAGAPVDGEQVVRRALAVAFKAYLAETRSLSATPPPGEVTGPMPDPMMGWRPISGESPEGESRVNVLSCTGRVSTIDAREARQAWKLAQRDEDACYWMFWQPTPALPRGVDFLSPGA